MTIATTTMRTAPASPKYEAVTTTPAINSAATIHFAYPLLIVPPRSD